MTEHAPDDWPGAGSTDSPADPLSLLAALERQHVEFAAGPSMAEVLARADRLRAGGIPRENIAADIRADREERAS